MFVVVFLVMWCDVASQWCDVIDCNAWAFIFLLIASGFYTSHLYIFVHVRCFLDISHVHRECIQPPWLSSSHACYPKHTYQYQFTCWKVHMKLLDTSLHSYIHLWYSLSLYINLWTSGEMLEIIICLYMHLLASLMIS